MLYITRDGDGSWQYWDIPAPEKYPSPPIWDEDDQLFYHERFEAYYWGATWGKFKEHILPHHFAHNLNLKKGKIRSISKHFLKQWTYDKESERTE